MDYFFLTLGLINGLSSIVTIISNVLVLLAIFKTPSLHTPSNVLLCSLSASDFATGIIIQPLFIIDVSPLPMKYSRPYFLYFGRFVFAVSLLTQMMIALDRFLAFHWHMRYPVKVTMMRIRVSVVIVWFTLIPFVIGYDFIERKYKLGISIPILICISAVILFCHFKIYLITRRHRRQIASQQQAVFLPTVKQGRSIRTAWYIYSLFVICLLPNLFIRIGETIVVNADSTLFNDLTNASRTCIFLNSMLNPFLFCYRSSKMYEAIRSMIKSIFFPKTNF